MNNPRVCLEHFHPEPCPGKPSGRGHRYRDPRRCRWTDKPEHVALVLRYRTDFPYEVIP